MFFRETWFSFRSSRASMLPKALVQPADPDVEATFFNSVNTLIFQWLGVNFSEILQSKNVAFLNLLLQVQEPTLVS